MKKKGPLILLGIGAGIALLVCMISLSLYGRIYFFDGYDITKFAWAAAIGCSVIGVVGLFSNILSDSKNWAIAIVVILVIALVASCSDNIGGSSSGGGSKKGNCNNCGGDGWDSRNGCSCVWCGGDGYSYWNP